MSNWTKMCSDFDEMMDTSLFYRFGLGSILCLCLGEILGTALCLASLSLSQCSSMVAFAVPATPIGTLLIALCLQYLITTYKRKPILPSTIADIPPATPAPQKTNFSDDEGKTTIFMGTNPLKVSRIPFTPQKKTRSSGITPPTPPPAPQKAQQKNTMIDENFVDLNPMRSNDADMV